MAKKVTFAPEDPLALTMESYKATLDAGLKCVRLDLQIPEDCLTKKGHRKHLLIPPNYDEFLDWDVDIYKQFEARETGISFTCPECKQESIHRDVIANNDDDFPLHCGVYSKGRCCMYSLRYQDREKHCKLLFYWTGTIILVPKGKPIARFLQDYEKLKKDEKPSPLKYGPPTFKKLTVSANTKSLVDLLGVMGPNDLRSKAGITGKR